MRNTGIIPAALFLAIALSAAAEPHPEPLGDAWTAALETEWAVEDAWFSVGALEREPGAEVTTAGVAPTAQQARFTLAHTRHVLDAARALAERLRPKADPKRLGALDRQWEALDARCRAWEASGEMDRDARRRFYLYARRLAREIAFANPLLDIERILFIKRHHPTGEFHMCDQYYGFNAVPGGGLFVLERPFSGAPALTNLLEDAVVEQGRMAGQRLEGGAFLSPELSFDGRTILFAYSEADGEYLVWGPESSWHIFRVNSDGTGLAQLTDGPYNDFDPCFLPSGRIAFVSERRGGYLRCGRECPTYTMFDMAADGTDIACLSYHETHEWHPSVDHNGMIVYTRWDYVDRDTNVAHHIWQAYPDGSNARSFHGNYPDRREVRPWMEMSIRAIPGSHKFVATAAAHHGHALGSLVLIDQHRHDDNAMAQLERLTPDAPFPEAERDVKPIRECMIYGTPWPLSEEDYLCMYARDARSHGLYWIDRYGNRELLYRDPGIPSFSPIPLRPRPMPPNIAPRAQYARSATSKPAAMAVMNVYESDFDWPEGTQIKALRVIQVLPKSTAPPNNPRIGVAEQSNARAVLGVAPVEADGSAYFEAPAGKLVYFQALDENGMAVQSMRSGAYVHPGDTLTCLGCHERKREAPPALGRTPLAMRRAPSKLEPEPEGSNPYSYMRLVQPVLDEHCAPCHAERDVLDLSDAPQDPDGWPASYANLAKDYGFYFNVQNGSIKQPVHGGSRSIAGQFGAHAAKLTAYLDESHYGVQLDPEERRRITLWLDCNSEFLGAYENTAAQAKGEIVWPSMD